MAFFKFLRFPKLVDEQPLRAAIAKGTMDVIGYVSAARVDAGRIVHPRTELVRFGSAVPTDEIDLGPAGIGTWVCGWQPCDANKIRLTPCGLPGVLVDQTSEPITPHNGA